MTESSVQNHDRPMGQEIGLASRPASTFDHEGGSASSQLGLQPVDGGRDAWMVLMAGFIFEALFWGVYLGYYFLCR